MGAITSPAFWASLGVLLSAFGIDLPSAFWDHVVAAIGGLAGIIGIISAWLGKGKQQ